MATQLKKAKDEVGRRGKEMQTMRAQNVTWSTDNKARREQVTAAKSEVEELRATNASVVAQASTLEERVAKARESTEWAIEQRARELLMPVFDDWASGRIDTAELERRKAEGNIGYHEVAFQNGFLSPDLVDVPEEEGEEEDEEERGEEEDFSSEFEEDGEEEEQDDWGDEEEVDDWGEEEVDE